MINLLILTDKLGAIFGPVDKNGLNLFFPPPSPGDQGLQDGLRGQGRGGQAHRLPHVRQHGRREAGLDQVHTVSRGSNLASWQTCRALLFFCIRYSVRYFRYF